MTKQVEKNDDSALYIIAFSNKYLMPFFLLDKDCQSIRDYSS